MKVSRTHSECMVLTVKHRGGSMTIWGCIRAKGVGEVKFMYVKTEDIQSSVFLPLGKKNCTFLHTGPYSYPFLFPSLLMDIRTKLTSLHVQLRFVFFAIIVAYIKAILI